MTYNELSLTADTLVNTASSLNFVCKEFMMTNGFYKVFKSAPKISIRAASD